MKKLDNNRQVFFKLVSAGLWERDVVLGKYGSINFSEILQLAIEQSVVGLVAAGLEHVTDVAVAQVDVLMFIGQTLQIEQRNRSMNTFVAELIERLRESGIYSILVKGQGIAQCYERPLWRSSGDVDLLISESNYQKAKSLLTSLAASVEKEYVFLKHLGMHISGWEVELHGSQRPRLTKRIDRAVDEVQRDVFYGGKVRFWINGQTQVFLPGADEDVIFVFTHILHHYYQEGVGLRQICDWCRLLYSYKNSINRGLLESRLRKMGLMDEWMAFAAYAVEYLGMPVDVMPLYSSAQKWNKKGERINVFVMEVGNFGHNRRTLASGIQTKGFFARKAATLWRRTADSFRHLITFPRNSLKIWCYMVWTGVKVVRGE